MVYGLWWFMVSHGSSLWYMPSWELVPDTTRTDLGTITCKWYIQFIHYLLISVEIYMSRLVIHRNPIPVRPLQIPTPMTSFESFNFYNPCKNWFVHVWNIFQQKFLINSRAICDSLSCNEFPGNMWLPLL